MKYYALRLKPGQDLIKLIKEYLIQENIEAGCILSCAGSLKPATLRLSDHTTGTVYSEALEIVSLSGTLSIHGHHLHMAISDGNGHVFGGHVLPGCTVYTTAEIIIGELDNYVFRREDCPCPAIKN